MSLEEDVVSVIRKLEAMVVSGNFDSGMDLLKRLQSMPITLQILRDTRVGMTVNSFRKACTNDQINHFAKTLIKSWKRLLNQPNSALENNNSCDSNDSTNYVPPSSAVPHTNNNSEKTSDSGTVRSATVQPNSRPNNNTSASLGETKFPATVCTATTDTVRLKCRAMLSAALRSGDTVPDQQHEPETLAELVEAAIYAEFRNTNTKYKNRVRSRVSNLRDVNNTMLRTNLLLGVISPEKMASMVPDEMASESMRALRERFKQEAFNDAQMATAQGTNTSLLKCHKCRKNNCTYNQVQTRSADEPMTTFVLCNECGNRWKF